LRSRSACARTEAIASAPTCRRSGGFSACNAKSSARAALTGSPSCVASPSYLDAKGAPKAIGDLHRHNCIGMRYARSGGIVDWELTDDKKTTAIKTSGTALVTDPMHAVELALADVGIAYAVEPLTRRHIREGRLQWLLPQCAVEYDGLFLYYSRRASLAPKLRVFIEAAKTILRP
jgi:DNA-binding transcriptional LysR family regulator